MSRVVILGAGGHGRVLLDVLRAAKTKGLAGFTDPIVRAKSVDGLALLGGDDALRRFPPARARLVNGLGVARSTAARRKLHEAWTARGYRFLTVVAPNAVISRSAVLHEGCQVVTRAVVHPGAVIGENAVLNTACVVEHDAVVGAHAFISPGAVLCGDVRIGAGAFIGAGAVVLPGVTVGAGAVVGGGALVARDVPEWTTAVGVPARNRR